MGRSTPLSSTAVPVRLPPVPRKPWCRPGGGQSLATAWAARLPGQRGLSRLVPCVRCLRCPPRPPLPGPQSRAWSREPEAPPAPGRPALPGRRPAPAPSPGEQHPRAPSLLGLELEPSIDPPRLTPDPGPAIDRPSRGSPPLPPRTPPRRVPDPCFCQSLPRFPLRPGASSLGLPRPPPPLPGRPLSLSPARPRLYTSCRCPSHLALAPFRVAAPKHALFSFQTLEAPTSAPSPYKHMFPIWTWRPSLRPSSRLFTGAWSPPTHSPTGSSSSQRPLLPACPAAHLLRTV